MKTLLLIGLLLFDSPIITDSKFGITVLDSRITNNFIITEVKKDSPAYYTGLQKDDIIKGIATKNFLHGRFEYREIVAKYIGHILPPMMALDGTYYFIHINRPSLRRDGYLRFNFVEPPQTFPDKTLGLYTIEQDGELIVLYVDRGLPAYNHGLRKNDIITGIDAGFINVESKRPGTAENLTATIKEIKDNFDKGLKHYYLKIYIKRNSIIAEGDSTITEKTIDIPYQEFCEESSCHHAATGAECKCDCHTNKGIIHIRACCYVCKNCLKRIRK